MSKGGSRGADVVLSPPPRSQDTKKYLRIYEDLDGGFVGDNQVLMLFHHLSSIFTHTSISSFFEYFEEKSIQKFEK